MEPSPSLTARWVSRKRTKVAIMKFGSSSSTSTRDWSHEDPHPHVISHLHFMCPTVSKKTMIPFGAMIEYHPISLRDQSRLHQFGGIFLGYALITVHLEIRHPGCGHRRIEEPGRIRSSSSKNQSKRSATTARRVGWCEEEKTTMLWKQMEGDEQKGPQLNLRTRWKA